MIESIFIDYIIAYRERFGKSAPRTSKDKSGICSDMHEHPILLVLYNKTGMRMGRVTIIRHSNYCSKLS